MAAAGYGTIEIKETIAFLEERRYLNDEGFGIDFASNRARYKHWGPARIQHRLRELGLSDSQIDLALERSFPEGERSAAETALMSFLRAHPRRRSESDEALRGRAYRHLVSRGFAPEVAYELQSSIIVENIELTAAFEEDSDPFRAGDAGDNE